MSESSLYPGALDSSNLYEVVARLSTTLTADITAATTTIPLTSTTGFPTQGYIVIDNETIKYISVAVSSVDATGGRGHAGTAASHTSTTQVLVSVTAAVFNKLRAGLIATQTAIGITGAFNFVGASGWIPTGTFTYASATTITVASGAASIYQIGGKIKLTQTTDKYFYVSAVADTLLTVNGAGLYMVANAAITSPYYSPSASPLGFPAYMTPGYIKARAYLSANQLNLTDATITKVNLNAESFDTINNFSTVNFRFEVPVTGHYLINGAVGYTSVVANSDYDVLIYKGGTVGTLLMFNRTHSASAYDISVNTSSICLLTKAEFVELFARVYAGVNTIDVTGLEFVTFLDVSLISII